MPTRVLDDLQACSIAFLSAVGGDSCALAQLVKATKDALDARGELSAIMS